jgi:SAM-dependent methyltransferase
VAFIKPSRLPLFPLILVREKLARGKRTREVGGEPAVMDEPQGVQEYDEFGATGEVGVHQFSALGISRLLPEGGTLLDLGCGSGRLLARLAKGRPDARIIGLDLSEPMLKTGRELLKREGLSDRVELRRGDITTFDAALPEQLVVISCNFALHHLPSEEVASRCFEAIARARSRTGCAIWLFDFARLSHPDSWPRVVSMVNMPGPVVRSDAIESERAAFSEAELRQLLEGAGLTDLHHARSRPLGEHQVHWAAARKRSSPVTGLWQETPASRESRFLIALARQAFPRELTRT